MIDLTIMTQDSLNHKFRVPNNFTILKLKEHIAKQVNVVVIQQRLIFCGRDLSDKTNLADIGIHGKVMHLIQKVQRLSTITTSGSSFSTTTNTNSRSGQTGGPSFRGRFTHDSTFLFDANYIPLELLHAEGFPHREISNRVSLIIDMIRKTNATLNILENQQTNGWPTASDAEHFPESAQQVKDISRSLLPESSTPQANTQSDLDSVNVSCEVDDIFPNTDVVTIDATNHMRLPSALMRHMHNYIQANYIPSSSTIEQTIESDATVVPDISPVGATNQSSADQTSGKLPSSATSEQNLRNDGQTAVLTAINDIQNKPLNERSRLREINVQINKLNSRLQPLYKQCWEYVNECSHFEFIEDENRTHRSQTILNGMKEVTNYISNMNRALGEIRVAYNRPPPWFFQSRSSLLQDTILHTTHSDTTTIAAALKCTTNKKYAGIEFQSLSKSF